MSGTSIIAQIFVDQFSLTLRRECNSGPWSFNLRAAICVRLCLNCFCREVNNLIQLASASFSFFSPFYIIKSLNGKLANLGDFFSLGPVILLGHFYGLIWESFPNQTWPIFSQFQVF